MGMNPLGNACLFVIDMQNGFVSNKSAPIVPAVADLLGRWRATGRPYVLSRFINYADSPYERLIGWSRMESSPEIDLVPEIAPAASGAAAVIDKGIYSAFTEEGIHLVERNGWDNIVVAGIATESCVLKTAVDAFELGLTPWVVTDASYSHAGAEPHEAGLLVAGRFIGSKQLVTSAEILDRAANSPTIIRRAG